jgi:hypothetical protein
MAMRSPRIFADLRHGALVEMGEVAAFEADRAARQAAGLLQEPHDRQRRDALAAAALADQRHRFPRIDRKGHAIDDRDGVPRRPEGNGEVVDVQQCHVASDSSYASARRLSK